MRKYFLLSAAALMVATSANATTDYAEVTAKATIEVANLHTCSPLNFGKIVLKKDNAQVSLNLLEYLAGDGSISSNQIISITGATGSSCTLNPYDQDYSVTDATLTNKEGTGTMTVTNITNDGGSDFWGTLNIPAKAVPGEYEGTFTITYNYE